MAERPRDVWKEMGYMHHTYIFQSSGAARPRRGGATSRWGSWDLPSRHLLVVQTRYLLRPPNTQPRFWISEWTRAVAQAFRLIATALPVP